MISMHLSNWLDDLLAKIDLINAKSAWALYFYDTQLIESSVVVDPVCRRVR